MTPDQAIAGTAGQCRSPATSTWVCGASAAAFGVQRQEAISLQGWCLHRAQPQRTAALLKEVAGENTARRRDRPLLRHLLEPPELRQWADEHREEEGRRVLTAQHRQRLPVTVLAGSMAFPG